MRPNRLLISLALLLGISFTASAQLKKVQEKQVNLKKILSDYNAYLASRPDSVNNRKGSGVKPFRRLEWFLESRLDENGNYPVGARWNAFIEQQRVTGLRKNSAVQAANWMSIGPNNIAGRIPDLAFDPNNPNVIWAGTAAGGVWRSTDGGSSWTPMNDQLPSLSVSCVVVHPTNSNIIYIGTGDHFGYAGDGVGVLKSIDGGATWTQTGLSWQLSAAMSIYEMVIDPGNPEVLVAATSDGIYRTSDGGSTWTQQLNLASGRNTYDIVINPTNSNILFAALYSYNSSNNGVYKSSDNGVTWTKLTSGLPLDATTTGRISLSISPSNPNVVYAGFSKASDSALLGIYRTSDGGNNWTLQSTSPNHYGSQGWYNNVIAVDPANPDIVYSGGLYMYKSTNGGVTWTNVTTSIHVDFHAIAFNAGALYVGNDGGVYKSTNGGSSWTDLNNGLVTMQIYKMGNDFNNPNRLMGGTQDNGTNEYNGSTAWTKRLGADGGEVIFDYTNSNIIYAEIQSGSHYKSTNGGLNWVTANNGLSGGPWITPVEMDPGNPNVLYTISNSNLYKTSDGAGSWSLLFDAVETLSNDIRVAPSDNQTIYVAGSSAIYKSTNGGGSFAKILSGSSIWAMAVHPNDAQTLYCVKRAWTANDHVFKTTAGGASWQNVTNNLPNVPCNTIVIDPAHPEVVYIGTDLGVYVSVDAGATWNGWNTGLPNVDVEELEIHPATRKIRAATHGRGMFEASMIEPAAPAAPSDLTITGMSSAEVSLAWADHADNEIGFKIERKIAGGVYAEIATIGINITNFIDAGLSINTEYFYRVRAYNGEGDSNYSNEVNVTTQASLPVAPSNLTASAAGSSQIDLAWTDNASSESGFKIERKIGAAGTYAEVAIAAANATSFADTGLVDNTAYFYRISAYNVDGVSAYSNEAEATTALAPPKVPSNLAVMAASTTQLNLAWTDNSLTEAETKIERRIGVAGAYIEIATVGANVTSYTDDGLSTDVLYYYRVRANNAAGYSSYSSIAAGFPFLGVNLAYGKPVLASSTIDSVVHSGKIVDGNRSSNWMSAHLLDAGVTQWLRIDLETPQTFNRVAVKWLVYFAKSYEIHVSNDDVNWTTVYSDNAANGGTDYFGFPEQTARYVRLYMTSPMSATASYYRVYEVEVYDGANLPLPTAPSGLTATAVNSAQINLAWTDNSNYETSFKIERKIGAAGTYAEIASTSSAIFYNAGLSENTEYFYRVRAYNVDGYSAYTNEVSATTPMAPPKAPGNLTASTISQTQINLAWADSSANESGFKIERKTGAAGTYAEIAIVAANVTNYSNTGLTAGTQYYYRVRAYNAGAHSAYTAEANATTLPNPPAAPTNLTATGVSSVQINLAWTDNANNETGFKIERKTGGSGNYAQIATVAANVTSYSNTGLVNNTQYYYRVRAYNAGGNSNYSNTANAKPKFGTPAAPTGLTASISGTFITLDWTDNSNNETGFKIERKTGAGNYVEIGFTAMNVKQSTIGGLSENTTYFHRVRAYNADGTSAYTNEVSNTTLATPALTATVVTTAQIDLAWTDNSTSEDGFKIERKIGTTGTYAQIATVGSNVTSYSNTGLTENTEYIYRIRAYNAGGHSNYSNETLTHTFIGANLALNKPATATSTLSTYSADKAVDNDWSATFWSSVDLTQSGVSQTQWWSVDLQSPQNFSRIIMQWSISGNHAKSYELQVSNDNGNWSSVYSTTTGDGGVDDVTFAPQTARYVRLYMTVRNSARYVVYEFVVTDGSSAAPSLSAPNSAPQAMTLFSNYPNPFNPATTIAYVLPEGANVTLKVINITGQEVATLVNRYQEAGEHRVTFKAAKLPSGTYFAVLKAGEVTRVQRMILMK
ncbi:MAG: fibronectin type III domain-containing protein [bacterium]